MRLITVYYAASVGAGGALDFGLGVQQRSGAVQNPTSGQVVLVTIR
jgi:hypothetical protein